MFIFDAFIWLVLIELVAFFGIAALNDIRSDGFAFMLTAGAIALAFLMTGVSPIDWFAQNISAIIVGFIAWFIIGAATAWFKWLIVVNSKQFQQDIKNTHELWLKKWDGNPDHEFINSYEFRKFTVAENSGDLIRWAVYWPMTLVWMVAYRLVKWTAIKVYESAVNLYKWTLNMAVRRAIK